MNQWTTAIVRGARTKGPIVVSFAFFVACGRTDPDVPPLTIHEADMPALVANAICGEIDRCCRMGDFSGRADTCVDFEIEALKKGATAARAAGGTFDPAAAARCIDAVRATVAECRSVKESEIVLADCARMYAGTTVAPGSPCLPNESIVSECAATRDGPGVCYTRSRTDGVESTCATWSVVGEGESCLATASTLPQCAAGLYCKALRCSRQPLRGEPCEGSYGDTCAAGSVCDRSVTKRCIEPAPPGSDCSGPTDYERCEIYSCQHSRCTLNMFFVFPGICAK